MKTLKRFTDNAKILNEFVGIKTNYNKIDKKKEITQSQQTEKQLTNRDLQTIGWDTGTLIV